MSTFPLDRPFERLDARTPLQEIVLRLVVDFYTDAPTVVGSATLLNTYLLVTARHIFSGIVEVPLQRESGTMTIEKRLSAVQVIPSSHDVEYLIWDVVTATLDPETDLALLHLSRDPGKSHPDRPLPERQPLLAAFPPRIGERVAAFGYRLGAINVSKNA